MDLCDLLNPVEDGGSVQIRDLDNLINKTTKQISKLKELVSEAPKLLASSDPAPVLQDIPSDVTITRVESTGDTSLTEKEVPVSGEKLQQLDSGTKHESFSSLPDVLSSCSLSSTSSTCSSYKSCEVDIKYIQEQVAATSTELSTSMKVTDAPLNKGKAIDESNTIPTTNVTNITVTDSKNINNDTTTSSNNTTTSTKNANEDYRKGSTSASSWQQFLSLPSQQHLVVERMYSGARRFVVLDFGEPILLTGRRANVGLLGLPTITYSTPWLWASRLNSKELRLFG